MTIFVWNAMRTSEKQKSLENFCEQMSNTDKQNGYAAYLIDAFSKTLADKNIKENICLLRLSALLRLANRLEAYSKRGYMDSIVNAIANKKCQMILKATTKGEIEKILNPKCAHYDGVRFYTDDYHVPEEELIGWCETSLRAPLNSVGFARYMEVFKSVFPEKEI